MLQSHGQTGAGQRPETAGRTLHAARQYDFFTRLVGLGVNGSNSRDVVQRAGIRPGDKVLDVACGTGSLTLTAKTVAGSTGEVHGIDAAPEMIAQAQRNAARTGIDVNFKVGLAEQLEFAAGTFDRVISRLAIHHLPDDLKRRCFAEVLRVLKPGGRIFLADMKAPGGHLLGHIASALIGPHGLETDVWGLPAMLESAGFENVTSGPTGSPFLAFVSGNKPKR